MNPGSFVADVVQYAGQGDVCLPGEPFVQVALEGDGCLDGKDTRDNSKKYNHLHIS